MYVGLALILAGPFMALGSVALALAPVVFLAVMAAAFVPFEERRLRDIFGADYETYTARVRRWL
jgi:protein-S-isoprenylcysteine O-methyltransferase Ste14